MEQHALKDLNNCLNMNIYSYLEASGDESSNLYLNFVNFLTPVLIRHLWQLKTVVFLHWCLLRAVLLGLLKMCGLKSDSQQIHFNTNETILSI